MQGCMWDLGPTPGSCPTLCAWAPPTSGCTTALPGTWWSVVGCGRDPPSTGVPPCGRPRGGRPPLRPCGHGPGTPLQGSRRPGVVGLLGRVGQGVPRGTYPFSPPPAPTPGAGDGGHPTPVPPPWTRARGVQTLGATVWGAGVPAVPVHPGATEVKEMGCGRGLTRKPYPAGVRGDGVGKMFWATRITSRARWVHGQHGTGAGLSGEAVGGPLGWGQVGGKHVFGGVLNCFLGERTPPPPPALTRDSRSRHTPAPHPLLSPTLSPALERTPMERVTKGEPVR